MSFRTSEPIPFKKKQECQSSFLSDFPKSSPLTALLHISNQIAFAACFFSPHCQLSE